MGFISDMFLWIWRFVLRFGSFVLRIDYDDEPPDEQDSDLNIEVAREADIIREGHELDQFSCDKNPGHSGFFPFKDLRLDDLSEEVRNEETLKTIKKWGSCVVRIVVDKIRDGEWVKEAGTGMVVKDTKHGFAVQTNHHVVGTDQEVKNCTVEFFYDSHDRSNVLISKGVKLVKTDLYRDISIFTFEDVPDFLYEMDEIDPFNPTPSLVIKYRNNHTETRLISKCFFLPATQYYTTVNLNDPEIKEMSITLHDKSISRLKSSYFKFEPFPQPMPSPLKFIEIYIVEDDGSRRELSGIFNQFGDDYVVGISNRELIFQDEVEKCRLVWIDEVISRGTRLYFEKDESNVILKHMGEIGFNEHVNETHPSVWILHFHPLQIGVMGLVYLPESMESTIDIIMCCIGHPHGYRKMVSFGRWLDKYREIFDNNQHQCTHKPHRLQHRSDLSQQSTYVTNTLLWFDETSDQPGEDCDCMEVNCFKYSCKTCKGSSGSPIFIPTEIFCTNSFLTHFDGKPVKKQLENGEWIENENIAWG